MKSFRWYFRSQKNYIRDGNGTCQYCGRERVIFQFTPDNEYASTIGLGCRECLKGRLHIEMNALPLNEYEVGGICVHMTAEQAAAWNRGDMDSVCWAGARLYVPGRVGAHSFVRDGEVVDVQGTPTVDTYPLALITSAEQTPKYLEQIGNQMEGSEAVLLREGV